MIEKTCTCGSKKLEKVIEKFGIQDTKNLDPRNNGPLWVCKDCHKQQ